MREPGPVLCLVLVAGCGDDGSGADASGDDRWMPDGPEVIDAARLCHDVPDGGPPPPFLAGSGWTSAATGDADMDADVSRTSDGAFVLGGRMSPALDNVTGTTIWGGLAVTVTGDEAFVARISAEGAPSWIHTTSGTAAVMPALHNTSAADGVAIAGGFEDVLVVNPDEPSPVSLTTAAPSAPFIARFGADG